MSLRVSSNQIIESSLLGINDAFGRFDAAQQKVNTGKQLNKPSDDPSGTTQSLDFRAHVAEIDQFNRTMDQAKGFLATSESALDSVTSLLRQARSLGVQGANDSLSIDTRTALAGQIQNIINQIGNIGNTSYGQRFVFAGQRTTSPPLTGTGAGFTYSGGTFANGDADLILDIGRGESMTINVTGDKVFTPILNALSALRDDVASAASRTVSQQDLQKMDDVINNTLTIRADMGAKVARIDSTKQRNELTKINFTQFISNIEDADIPKAVVEMQSAQTAYQAALQSTAYSFGTSLLDFLK